MEAVIGAFAEVLARYPQPIRERDWSRIELSGGLSGAEIWRGDRAGKHLFYAKGYPPGVDPLQLSRRHRWCAVALRAGLAFVPEIVAAGAGDTFILHRNLCWEIGGWMPGNADFDLRPTRTKLLSACDALIDLLGVWRGIGIRREVPPAVRNRLALFETWERHPAPAGSTIPHNLDFRARAAIAVHLPRARPALAPWAARILPCQPCVRDLRREHFLFAGDALTGLIDYGAAAWDTPATDAARMLGEHAGDDGELYDLGLARFVERLGTEICPPELVRTLDHSGVVGSVIHWLMRLQRNGAAHAPNAEIEFRLERLVERMERATFAGSPSAVAP